MAISTFIVDDTVTYRQILSEAAGTFPELSVAGTAASGAIALKKMAQTPVQLVLLDIHMPDMDGVETLRHIRAEFPDVFVVMVSGLSTRGADTTIQALQLGALDFVRKPDGESAQENFKTLVNYLRPIVRLVEMRLQVRAVPGVRQQQPGPLAASAKKIIAPSVPTRFGIVAIGVSTGGPEALTRLMPQFPPDFPVPVVLVQHMPPLFTKSLAESLAKKSQLRIVEASEAEPVNRGTVYIAPGGKHMLVRGPASAPVIGLNDGPPENSCRPSVDVLFRSVASVYGDAGILAVMLTGMGSDGCAGVRACKRKPCFCITQSEQSCVVYGMPRAVDEAGLADLSLPLDRIAGEITNRCKRGTS